MLDKRLESMKWELKNIAEKEAGEAVGTFSFPPIIFAVLHFVLFVVWLFILSETLTKSLFRVFCMKFANRIKFASRNGMP